VEECRSGGMEEWHCPPKLQRRRKESRSGIAHLSFSEGEKTPARGVRTRRGDMLIEKALNINIPHEFIHGPL